MLHALVKACRENNDRVSVRLPIKIKIMNLLIDMIQEFFINRGQTYLAKLYCAMVTAGYFGLLRIGEMTKSVHNICVRSVLMGRNKDKIQFKPMVIKNPQ